MGWLKDTAVLVTGAGSGLGRAVVERFVDEGAQVAVLEINEAKAAALVDDLGDVIVTVGDATQLADNQRAVADAVHAFGRLDVFVGNAGLWDYGTSLLALPDDKITDAFDEIFALNVKGYLLGAKAAVPELQKTSGAMPRTGAVAASIPVRQNSPTPTGAHPRPPGHGRGVALHGQARLGGQHPSRPPRAVLGDHRFDGGAATTCVLDAGALPEHGQIWSYGGVVRCGSLEHR